MWIVALHVDSTQILFSFYLHFLESSCKEFLHNHPFFSLPFHTSMIVDSGHLSRNASRFETDVNSNAFRFLSFRVGISIGLSHSTREPMSEYGNLS